jgi:hypothetical protein
MDKMDDNDGKHRFYELDELKGLNENLNRVEPIKIFVCNQCGSWNKVHEKDLMAYDDFVKRRKEDKRTIHIQVTPEFKIIWDKFKANFGTHERALIIALSEFNKQNH